MNYAVAVRSLCEFTAKRGDLDLRFTPSPTAQEGMAGHQRVAARRGADYQAEITLRGEFKQLQVRGRADGYAPALNQLEEIKTFRGDLSRLPDNHRHLHWAQAKVYGWLMCQARGLPEIRLALVYYDILSQQETLIGELHTAASLQLHFEQLCEAFLAWAQQELAHRQRRDQALTTLVFPHPRFRSGQRPLAEAVYKAASTGSCLLAQAPTGIGKTIGTLFPLLKAFPGQALDKLFFLTAKTPGRALALHGLARLRRSETDGAELPLRVLELVARDKACEHPDKACQGEACPLAKGFYDRLPEARSAAVATGFLDQPTLRAVALHHGICPYYLGQDLARWCDAVVADYNYFFDASALLHGLTVANQWRVGVLVDEAHNLLERARAMYSAALDQDSLLALRRVAPAILKKPLERLQRQWNALLGDQHDAYRVHAELPTAFLTVLQQACSAITEYLSEQPAALDSPLQRFYFEALQFGRMAEAFDSHSLLDSSLRHVPATPDSRRKPGGGLLSLRNVIPAAFLAPRFAASHSTTLFSATLSPPQFYRDTLGLPDTTAWVDVQSPFRAEQLAVRLISGISTRYQHRAVSLAPIVALIARQYAAQPGNYLAFFSSFEYLQQVLALFQTQHPRIPRWAQTPRMDEAARGEFLQRFTPESRGIGFAVLGGAFAEGVDLPGARLIGAFVATLGLPPLNPVNTQFVQRMHARFGNGYAYTYLYPGLQKVVQAAGRVIRTESDQGVVYLIDERFCQAQVRDLLPAWWCPEVVPCPLPVPCRVEAAIVTDTVFSLI
ncbi:MAG: ATP-dependent DNA helicase [Pseudomonadota bacterium]